MAPRCSVARSGGIAHQSPVMHDALEEPRQHQPDSHFRINPGTTEPIRTEIGNRTRLPRQVQNPGPPEPAHDRPGSDRATTRRPKTPADPVPSAPASPPPNFPDPASESDTKNFIKKNPGSFPDPPHPKRSSSRRCRMARCKAPRRARHRPAPAAAACPVCRTKTAMRRPGTVLVIRTIAQRWLLHTGHWHRGRRATMPWANSPPVTAGCGTGWRSSAFGWKLLIEVTAMLDPMARHGSPLRSEHKTHIMGKEWSR